MSPLFDAHCDTAFAMYSRGEGLRSNSCHTDLERGAACSPRGQVYAVWQHGDGLAVKAREVLGGLLREIELNSDLVALCRSYGDIKAAFSAGKQAAIISIEGAELISCSEAELERVHGLGVRIINLCWNSDNALCGSAVSGGGGLTEKGRSFVRMCGELGVAVDLSHASDETARDVLELGCVHVLASHSDCRSLCNVPRNLPDDLLRDIAASGGVVGLNLYPPFLGGNELALAAGHVRHMLDLCGERCVCLGCDLDGVDSLPDGISGIQDMPRLRETLISSGISAETVDAIFFDNLMDFWERAL